jgi:Zn-dependent protease with chaperone function
MRGGLDGARQMFGKGSWLDWLAPTLLSTHPPDWKRMRALEPRALNLPTW